MTRAVFSLASAPVYFLRFLLQKSRQSSRLRFLSVLAKTGTILAGVDCRALYFRRRSA